MLVLLCQVRGLPGTYIVNQHGSNGQPPRTLITFNQGGYWSPIAAPNTDESGQPTNCRLVTDCDIVSDCCRL